MNKNFLGNKRLDSVPLSGAGVSGRLTLSWNLFTRCVRSVGSFIVLASLGGQMGGFPSVGALEIATIERSSPVDFEREILPLFNANCLACHNETKSKAGLILETPQTILAGGDSGPSVVPGKASESLLLIAAAHLDEDLIMPPEGNKSNARNFTPSELGLLSLWIAQGAKGEVGGETILDWQPISERVQPIYSVALNESGRYVAYGKGSKASVFEIPTRRHVGRLVDPALGADRAHLDLVNSIAFHPSKDLVATGGFREVKLWGRLPRIETFSLLSTGSPSLTAASISGDGLVVGIACDDGTLRCLELSTSRLLWRSRRLSSASEYLNLSYDGHWALSIGEDRSLRLVGSGDLASGIVLAESVETARWGGDERRFASIDSDGVAYFWKRLESGAFESTRLVLNESVSAICFMPNGNHMLLVGTVSGDVHFVDLSKMESRRSIKTGKSVEQLEINGAADRLLIASGDGHASLWDLENGKRLHSLEGARLQQRGFRELKRQSDLLKGATELAKDALNKATERLAKANERAVKAEKDLAGEVAARAESIKKLAASESALVTAEELVLSLDEQLDAAEERSDKAKMDYEQGKGDLRALVFEIRTLENDREASDIIEGERLDALVEKVADLVIAEGKADKALEELRGNIGEKKKSAKSAVALAKKSVETDMKKNDAATRSVDLARNELELAKRSVERSHEAKRAEEKSVAVAQSAEAIGAVALARSKTELDEALSAFKWIQFTSDGDKVLAIGEDAAVNFWWVDTGEELDGFEDDEGGVILSQMVTDRTLLSVRQDGTASLRYLDQSWQLTHTIQGQGLADRVNALDFSEDGALLAIGGGDPSRSGNIKIWDLESMKFTHDFKDIHSDVVFALQFSPRGNLIASAGADRFARVLDLGTERPVYSLEGHTHYVMDVSWQADGRVLVSAGADGMAKVWDATTGERKKNIEGFKKEVTGVGFIGGNAEVLASSGDSTIAVFGLDGKKRRTMAGSRDFVLAESVSGDGRLVAAGGQKGQLRIWDLATGKILVTVE